MNFGIVGVGKIGKYHVRDFLSNGWKLKGIVTSNIDSAQLKASELEKEYGIKVNFYGSIDTLIKNEDIDTMCICSPTETHHNYILKCIDNNINIFCEKPFIYNINEDNIGRCRELLDSLTQKSLRVGINTQWVYGIKQLLKPELGIRNIELYMEHHKTKDDINFFVENICHMNSIIIYLLGDYRVSNIKYDYRNYPCTISFIYGKIFVKYIFGHPHNKKVIFKINGVKFERVTNLNYDQSFKTTNNINIRIKDPFKLSIKHFTNNTSLISNQDIFKNIQITDTLMEFNKEQDNYKYSLWFGDYLEHCEDEQLWSEIVSDWYEKIIFKLDDIPSKGKIVVLGTNNCVSFNKLIERFGEDRCIGFDLYNPTNHKSVVIKDCNLLTEKMDIAFCHNDLGNNELTPKLKYSGAEWAAKNLVKGGYLLNSNNLNCKKIPYEELTQKCNCLNTNLLNMKLDLSNIKTRYLEGYMLSHKL